MELDLGWTHFWYFTLLYGSTVTFPLDVSGHSISCSKQSWLYCVLPACIRAICEWRGVDCRPLCVPKVLKTGPPMIGKKDAAWKASVVINWEIRRRRTSPINWSTATSATHTCHNSSTNTFRQMNLTFYLRASNSCGGLSEHLLHSNFSQLAAKRTPQAAVSLGHTGRILT